MDNYYFQQAIHLSDTMFSLQKMQQYYNDLSIYFNNSFPDAGSDMINEIYYDTLHGLIASYNNGSPTRHFFGDIELNMYVQGWKDCEPTLAEIINMNPWDTLNRPGYSYKYVLSDSVYIYDGSEYLIDENRFVVNRYDVRYLVNIIDKTTGSIIKGGYRQFGYSASQKYYCSLLRY